MSSVGIGRDQRSQRAYGKSFIQANAVLGEMVADGAITSEERTRMVIGSYPRQKRDLLAPFERDGRFQGLSVEDIEISELPDVSLLSELEELPEWPTEVGQNPECNQIDAQQQLPPRLGPSPRP